MCRRRFSGWHLNEDALKSLGAFDPLVFIKRCHELLKDFLLEEKLLLRLIKQCVRDKTNACFACRMRKKEILTLLCCRNSLTDDLPHTDMTSVNLLENLKIEIPYDKGRFKRGMKWWPQYLDLDELSLKREADVMMYRIFSCQTILPYDVKEQLILRYFEA